MTDLSFFLIYNRAVPLKGVAGATFEDQCL